MGWEPSAATALFLNGHYLDRDKDAPPATDNVQVLLKRPAFSQLARIPTYRDLGVDLDGGQDLAKGFTLKAKGFWHGHVDDYESYKDQEYEQKIATSRYDDTHRERDEERDGRDDRRFREAGLARDAERRPGEPDGRPGLARVVRHRRERLRRAEGPLPTLSQLYSSKGGNTNLKSERTVNTTASVSHPVGSAVRLELGGFYYDVSDMITRNGSNATNAYQNVGKVRMAGFEAIVEATPLPGLSLRADYMYVNARGQSDVSVSDDVTNVPAHKAGFFAEYTVPGPKTLLDLDMVYVGSMYSSLPSPAYPTDPVKKVNDFVLFGAKVTQEVVKGVRAHVSVRNLFDTDDESEAGSPGSGRTFAVGAAATF